MNDQEKTREELLAEIRLLRQENELIKAAYENDHAGRQKAEEALSENEKIWQSLVAATPDFLILLDREGRMLFLNHVPKGYNVNDLIGKSAYDILPPEAIDFFKQKLTECIDTGKNLFFEYNGSGDHGAIRIFEQWFVPITDRKNGVIVMAVSRDITERRKSEAELEFKNSELQRVNAEKDKFFSIIAHDLRGPFNSFLGLSKIMAEELPGLTRTEIERIAVSMRNSATNLYRLLDNLLQWAGIQQGLIPFNPKNIFLHSFADDCKTLVFESAQNKGIDISCHIPEDIVVFADYNMLRTVLWNLASNAIKFTHQHGKIRISAQIIDDKHVEITVKDSGIGMKPDLINNLFKLDVKTSRRGTDGELSTGLGLLLCKDLLERHGSKLWVESEEGEGSTFRFLQSLPDFSDSEISASEV